MGLDVYMKWPGAATHPAYPGSDYQTEVDVPSTRYPEHLFKRNYLRSSYNDGGFNGVVGNLLGGRDLYWVFEQMREKASDPYGGTFRPTKTALRDARARAESLLTDLRVAEPLGVSWEDTTQYTNAPNFVAVKNDQQALAVYREQVRESAGKPFGEGGFSNANGAFYLGEPLRVKAMIKGTGFGGPGFYLILESDLEWYIKAAEILIEFIDEALSHPRVTISWSG